jgi:hypothetical protein
MILSEWRRYNAVDNNKLLCVVLCCVVLKRRNRRELIIRNPYVRWIKDRCKRVTEKGKEWIGRREIERVRGRDEIERQTERKQKEIESMRGSMRGREAAKRGRDSLPHW